MSNIREMAQVYTNDKSREKALRQVELISLIPGLREKYLAKAPKVVEEQARFFEKLKSVGIINMLEDIADDAMILGPSVEKLSKTIEEPEEKIYSGFYRENHFNDIAEQSWPSNWAVQILHPQMDFNGDIDHYLRMNVLHLSYYGNGHLGKVTRVVETAFSVNHLTIQGAQVEFSDYLGANNPILKDELMDAFVRAIARPGKKTYSGVPPNLPLFMYSSQYLDQKGIDLFSETE